MRRPPMATDYDIPRHYRLANVYAVQLYVDGEGRSRYIPRSQALPTVDAPKLWVKRADAERALKLCRDRKDRAAIVRFQLVEVGP